MALKDEVIKFAQSCVGIKEAKENDVVFNTVYYGGPVSGPDYPWCVAFLWYVFTAAGAGNLFYGGRKTAYAPALYDWAREAGRLSASPERGDIAFFDYNGDGLPDHAGLVESVGPRTIITIEGNVNNAVTRRDRGRGDALGYFRPAWEAVPFVPYAAHVQVSDYLNVRTGPGTGFPIMSFYNNELFRLPNGLEVAIVEERGSWGRLDDIQGWVCLDYVRRVEG